ncbi:MAG: 50S ribosomal protein L4 [Frankiaceae bacterium]
MSPRRYAPQARAGRAESRTLPVESLSGDSTRTVALPGETFDVQVNVALIHQVVVAQLAAARQGTHDTKTRGEVRGGGRKPYRQKGTGRARQGSLRAPQFTGGGVVHGPTPRSYEQRTPKKMKAAALRGALSDRARHDRVHVVAGLVEGDEPATKPVVAALRKIADSRHVLVVAPRSDELTWKSLRNCPQVHLLDPGQLNAYDVLVSDDVVFTEDGLAAFLGTPGAAGAAGSSAPADLTKSQPAEVAE